MSILKPIVLRALLVPGVAALLTRLTRNRATIFMLHRFQHPELGITGHDTEMLRRCLAYLRRHRFELAPLRDVFLRLGGDGPPLHKTVAFTIDDGYFDHAEIGAPIFAEFDCPVTTFVTTGFLDGELWFWWDRIEYVFHGTAQRELRVRANGFEWSSRWQTDDERRAAQADFTGRCKAVTDSVKLSAITELARSAEVDLPATPPERYAPMSWDQLRQCESRGMTFGPHTVTHPVLARTADDQSRHELIGSWNRLCEEAGQPVPVFCYPNGRFQDFGEREVSTLREMDMLGAVVGAPGGGPSTESFQQEMGERFRVRRYTLPERIPEVLQFVTGFDRLQRTIRREHPA